MFKALILTLGLGIVWTAVLGAGAILVWRGARGKAIDNLPRCRRCKYNVGHRRNRPHRCPECGGNLQLLGSVRLGARRMQGSLVTWGVVLVLIGLSPIGVLIWRAMPRAVPAVAAALPAKAPVTAPPGPVNLFAAGRAEKMAGARLAVEPLPTTGWGKLVDPIETEPTPAPRGLISRDEIFDLIAARRADVRPLEFTAPLGGYYGGAHVEPFQVEMQPPEQGGPDLEARPPERARLSPWSYSLEQRNAWAGSINVYGTFVGIGVETSTLAGPGRAIGPQRAGPGVITGNRISGLLMSPLPVFGGASTSIRGPGRPGGFSGGLNSFPGRLGGGFGSDLLLTQPVPVTSQIGSGLRGP